MKSPLWQFIIASILLLPPILFAGCSVILYDLGEHTDRRFAKTESVPTDSLTTILSINEKVRIITKNGEKIEGITVEVDSTSVRMMTFLRKGKTVQLDDIRKVEKLKIGTFSRTVGFFTGWLCDASTIVIMILAAAFAAAAGAVGT